MNKRITKVMQTAHVLVKIFDIIVQYLSAYKLVVNKHKYYGKRILGEKCEL